ncbi:MAG: recombination protein RecR [Deltaproteobacteria bacterium]|nr:recombination protein RecR [Deltaproteobacteria bacterium]
MKDLEALVHELGKLPSIGEKTALRLALHILRQPEEYGKRIAAALNDTIGRVHFCDTCQNLATASLCSICNNPSRDASLVCVVEDIADLQAIERSNSFNGRYHVLHGALSPIDGIGPNELKIGELKKRLETQDPEEQVHEIILATNSNVNGDATAVYLSQIIRAYPIKLTKLASGIPVGGHLEFTDQQTLAQAINRRLEF